MSNETTVFYKKAKNKARNYPLVKGLITLETERKQMYLNCLCCNSIINVSENLTSSRYCKTRLCISCSKIRAAIRAKHYSPYVSHFTQFTTLTFPNVTIEKLAQALIDINKFFTKFTDNYRKQYKIYFQGMLNIEITINTVQKTVHPHVHIYHQPIKTWISSHSAKPHNPIKPVERMQYLINGKTKNIQIGTRQNIYYQNQLSKAWLKHFPSALSYRQRVELVDQFNIMEVVKYMNKPFSLDKKKPNQTMQQFKQSQTDNFNIYTIMLDKVFEITKGKRLFRVYNVKAPKLSELQEDNQIAKTSNNTEKPDGIYRWNSEMLNWISQENIGLVDYTQDQVKEMKQIISKNKFLQ
jgi:hypothetical protein